MFALDERDVQPGCREIRVRGELDLAVAPELERAIERADEYGQVVISLEECDFLDSTGIAAIVGAYHARVSGNRRLAVCAPEGQVRRVLDLTGVSNNGLVFENAADALAAAGDRVETQFPDDPTEN
jgi:anti-sigma B factor antagonist